MAVTILERPEGRVLSSTVNTATVSESYGAGDAQFVSTTVHGLTDGDFIYAESDIENYAGFWYVDVTTTGIFKLKQYPTGPYVQFIANGSITWQVSTQTHGWSAVHLPITYRLSTNLYPVNSSDTTRNINSVQDSNGFTVILLSGSLGSAVNTYDFVKITLPSDTDLSGVYQILEFISPTVLLINLAYDATNNFTGATALKHYNNYNVLVRVYAGINSAHQWTAEKPYELAATIPMIPDENNELFFSINEILKSYITTQNNLTLGTLPNNLDFWVQFYIETAEQYDDSDGYTFGTFTSNYTSDQANFEGYAANAKLEFKNLHSGYLSAYINPIKWLTNFSELLIYTDQYWDISFINPIKNASIGYRVNGVDFAFDNDGDEGVYRFQPIISVYPASVYIIANGTIAQPTNNTFTGTLSPWTNVGTGVSWVANANMARVTLTAGQTSTFLEAFNYPLYAGTYQITFDYATTATGPQLQVTVYGIVSGQAPIILGGAVSLLAASGTAVINDTIPNYIETIAIVVDNQLGVTAVVDIDNVTFDLTSPAIVSDELIVNSNGVCKPEQLNLTWLINQPGFEYWVFTAQKDHIVEITEAITTKKNILPTWPKSYGSQADTIKRQTLRVSNKAYTVRSQLLTEDQVDAIAFIKSSVLAQIIVSRTDRRTVTVDTESFIVRKDGDKTHEIAFNISFTDDIPVQSV